MVDSFPIDPRGNKSGFSYWSFCKAFTRGCLMLCAVSLPSLTHCLSWSLEPQSSNTMFTQSYVRRAVSSPVLEILAEKGRRKVPDHWGKCHILWRSEANLQVGTMFVPSFHGHRWVHRDWGFPSHVAELCSLSPLTRTYDLHWEVLNSFKCIENIKDICVLFGDMLGWNLRRP